MISMLLMLVMMAVVIPASVLGLECYKCRNDTVPKELKENTGNAFVGLESSTDCDADATDKLTDDKYRCNVDTAEKCAIIKVEGSNG